MPASVLLCTAVHYRALLSQRPATHAYLVSIGVCAEVENRWGDSAPPVEAYQFSG